MSEGEEALRVEAGHVAVTRLYDVAHGIDLVRVEREAAASATRIRLVRAKPKAVFFAEAPVDIALGRLDLALTSGAAAAEVTARVYEFGAVSLTFRVRATSLPWAAYVDLVNEMDVALTEAPAWDEHLARVRRLIAPALDRSTAPGLDEDYLLATVQRFDRPLTGDALLQRLDPAPLLAGETQPLSDAARRDLLRHSYTYYRDDLVVISWSRALIVEPSGDTDVADVLEVANAQLLELRYYDARLNTELPRMYERVAQARRAFGPLARRRYANLARELRTLVAEVTEVAERIDNALVVTEDVYLARVYAAALEQFRVRAWSAAVERKLALIRDAYTSLYDEAATARAEYLELAIVLLIVLEIVLAFLL